MIKKGSKVSLHYKGTLDNGTIFDTSEGRDPLVFEAGSGMVIQGFDEGVLGMTIGQKKMIHIEPENAYGAVNDQMIFKFDRAGIPTDIPLELGGTLNMHDGQQDVQVIIKEITESHIVLDANHPLAGLALNFDLEIVQID